LNCILKRYDKKPEEPAANGTATANGTFQDWINRQGVASLTIVLGIELGINEEYMVIENAEMHWEMLVSLYKSMLKLNIFEIRKDLWSMKVQNSDDVDNYASRIVGIVWDYSMWARQMTTGTEAADMNSATTIAKMSKQEHIIYLFRRI
jgi:hypothetical protein